MNLAFWPPFGVLFQSRLHYGQAGGSNRTEVSEIVPEALLTTAPTVDVQEHHRDAPFDHHYWWTTDRPSDSYAEKAPEI
jgi:hypothetical protein